MSTQCGSISKIVVAIVAHPSRMSHVNKVMESLESEGCKCFPFVDYHGIGAARNHHRAIRWAANQDCRVLIMEDDAIPVIGFVEKAKAWIAIAHSQVISFYLGTSRPKDYQPIVTDKVINARHGYIRLDKFIHGVCYTMNREYYKMAAESYNVNRPADFAIGECFPNRQFLFVTDSLVEHLDGDSVDTHQDGEPRNEPRKARFLADKLIF